MTLPEAIFASVIFVCMAAVIIAAFYFTMKD